MDVSGLLSITVSSDQFVVFIMGGFAKISRAVLATKKTKSHIVYMFWTIGC